MPVSVEVPKPRKHEVIEDVWFGEEGAEYPKGDGPYVFTAPPTGTVLSAFLLNEGSQTQWYEVIAAKLEWLQEGFDAETWDHLTERMGDPADPFDSNVMAAMHDALVQELARRPFTSSPASTSTRRRSTGAAGRKPKAETSGT